MKPEWFDKDKVPYEQMWESDAVWMEEVLEGKRVKGKFVYVDENTLLEHKVEPWNG